MGEASEPTPMNSWLTHLSFIFPQIGGPMVSRGEEGHTLSTASTIGNLSFEDAFLDSTQVQYLMATNEIRPINCAYNPRSTKDQTKEHVLDDATRRVLSNVKKQLTESPDSPIILSDIDSSADESSIPSPILIPQVRALLLQEGKSNPKMMSVGLHCRLIGRPGRFQSLIKFIDYVKKFDDIWLCKRIDIAKHWIKNYPSK